MAPRIHFIAPAGSCRKFVAQLGLASAGELLDHFQGIIGPAYKVRGRPELIDVDEDELSGGRTDDEARAEDLQTALADDDVAAIVAIRGGAWFSRILPRIDFSVLTRRGRHVAVFGFSELTTLVNIVASYPMGRGVYDMGPAFLMYGLKRHAELHLGMKPENDTREPRASARADPCASSEMVSSPTSANNATIGSDDWARHELPNQLRIYFADLISMIEGRGTQRRPICRPGIDSTGRPLNSRLPDEFEAVFVGGNLCVLTTLLGSPYRPCIEPAGRWLLLEDLNEKPERIDRFLAHLTLAGFWEQCAGVLIGDFHRREQQLTPAVCSLLRYHLPKAGEIPILTTEQIGHIWPMAPLPLNQPVRLEKSAEREYALTWRPMAIQTVAAV